MSIFVQASLGSHQPSRGDDHHLPRLVGWWHCYILCKDRCSMPSTLVEVMISQDQVDGNATSCSQAKGGVNIISYHIIHSWSCYLPPLAI